MSNDIEGGPCRVLTEEERVYAAKLHGVLRAKLAGLLADALTPESFREAFAGEPLATAPKGAAADERRRSR